MAMPSPIGQYIVDCEDIVSRWPDPEGMDLTMDIKGTYTPGVYEAVFDFGVIEGVMVLGLDERTVERYCAWKDLEAKGLDRGDFDYDEHAEDGDEDDEDDHNVEVVAEAAGGSGSTTTGSKRKASGAEGPPSKKAKKADGTEDELVYAVRVRSIDPGEGEISYRPQRAKVVFSDRTFASFTGDGEISIGHVLWTARKISAEEPSFFDSWGDYVEVSCV